MLPSTFFEQKFDNATLARKLKAKEEMAEFWQQVVLDRTREISKDTDHKFADKAGELESFQEKLLEGTEFPTLREILRFSKLFREELDIQNMSKKQLHAMSRMCGLPVANAWWPGHLEVQLRHHITDLRREDRDYLWEGIDSITKAELIEACRKRAIRFHDVTEEDMRADLVRWLELSANNKEIPTSLLLWIQSFYLREFEAVDDSVNELQMTSSVADPEPKDDEIFLGMAERQLEKVSSLQRKLEEVQQEIEEVLAEAETNDNQEGSSTKDVEEKDDDSHEQTSVACAMEEAQEEKKLLKQRMKDQEQTLDLYKEVVSKQKELIDHQLGFLVSMRDNKPTKHKDVDVVLLDQQIRIMEMLTDFKKTASHIEQILADPDSTEEEKKKPKSVKWPEDVPTSRELRYRAMIGDYIAARADVNSVGTNTQSQQHQQF